MADKSTETLGFIKEEEKGKTYLVGNNDSIEKSLRKLYLSLQEARTGRGWDISDISDSSNPFYQGNLTKDSDDADIEKCQEMMEFILEEVHYHQQGPGYAKPFPYVLGLSGLMSLITNLT